MRHWLVLVLFLLGVGTLRLVACGDDSCVEDEDCNDGDPCTSDWCKEPDFDLDICGGDEPRTCRHSSKDDGAPCGLDKVCMDGVCVDPCIGVVCDDDDACTDDSCWLGDCEFTAVVCDDDNECTQDTCDPAEGVCVFTAIPDGYGCPGPFNICEAGACVDACDSTSDEEYPCPIRGLEDYYFCCPGESACRPFCQT